MDLVKPPKRNGNFFDRFEEAAQNNVDGAKLLEQLCRDITQSDPLVKQLHDLEHKGDDIGHAVYAALNQTFIPPLDREDILALVIALDDVIDLIHEAGDAICCYNVKQSDPTATALARVVVDCTQAVADELPKLRQRRTMHTLNHSVIRIHQLENRADDLLRGGVTELFKDPKDPIKVMAWSRIYETMEKVTDRCEDVADVLLGLAIKHA